MADAPRRWYRVRLRTLVLLILLAVTGLSVYSYWTDYADRSTRRERELLSPARGVACTVVLRRDLVGIARVSPTPSKIDGVENSVTGRFRSMNDQWIVLDGETDRSPQQWIPRDKVLVIQVLGE